MNDDGSIVPCEQQKKCEANKAVKVAQCDPETGELIQIFSSLREAGRETKISPTAISMAANLGRTTGGRYYHCFIITIL